tara:strand:+ start:10763 stop:11431 length:669 start_codon:yes stop_codon:yes gene_type:complete
MIAHRFNIAQWKGILDGETVFLIGNGPSLIEENLGLLEGRFSIGMNRCFKVFDPTILIWQDRGMYANDGIEKIRLSKAIKVCRDSIDDHKEFNNFTISRGNFSFKVSPHRLQGYGCTGALAAQLAVAMGAGRLVLLGCDGKYGEHTDFYGNNPDHKSHTLLNFDRAYRFIQQQSPVEVISCCSNDLWERSNLEEVVNSLSDKKQTRIQWISKFLSSELTNTL